MFQRIIDYLKMDIEYSEWDSLATALKENVLRRVKQFGIETHTKEVFKGQKTHTRTIFILYEHSERNRTAGIQGKFSSHYNHYGLYTSHRTGLVRTCCMELVYLNINFLKPDYEHTMA